MAQCPADPRRLHMKLSIAVALSLLAVGCSPQPNVPQVTTHEDIPPTIQPTPDIVTEASEVQSCDPEDPTCSVTWQAYWDSMQDSASQLWDDVVEGVHEAMAPDCPASADSVCNCWCGETQ